MKYFNQTYVGIALALTGFAVLFQNCAAAPPPDLSQMSQSSVGVVGPAPTPAGCAFNSTTIASGDYVMVYPSATVPAGSSCVPEKRTCTNGFLSGNNYTITSCSVTSAAGTASCSFGTQTIPHGGSVAAYANSSVGFGGDCNAAGNVESRICTNGVLSGSFMFASCSVQAATDCLFNGQTIPSGGSVLAYNRLCTLTQTRVCTNGVLSGAYSFTADNCPGVIDPACKVGTLSTALATQRLPCN